MALPAWHLLVAVTQVESHPSHRQTGAEESLNSRNDSTTSYQKSLDVEKKDSSLTQCLLTEAIPESAADRPPQRARDRRTHEEVKQY